jgi:hypothetical protein
MHSLKDPEKKRQMHRPGRAHVKSGNSSSKNGFDSANYSLSRALSDGIEKTKAYDEVSVHGRFPIFSSVSSSVSKKKQFQALIR